MTQHGINFRGTAAYVTDGADDTYCIASGGYVETYPIVRDGITFGWDTATNTFSYNMTTGQDVRLAGSHYISTSNRNFRIDLGGFNGTGEYTIHSAHGDLSYSRDVSIVLLDDTSSVHSAAQTTGAANTYMDTPGNLLTAANWPGNEAGQVETIATGPLWLRLVNTQDTHCAVQHISLEWTAAAAGFTPRSYPRGANRGVMRGAA